MSRTLHAGGPPVDLSSASVRQQLGIRAGRCTGRGRRAPTRTPRTCSAAARPGQRDPAAIRLRRRGPRVARMPGAPATGRRPCGARRRTCAGGSSGSSSSASPMTRSTSRATAPASPRRSMSSPCSAMSRATAARSPATAWARAAGSQARLVLVRARHGVAATARAGGPPASRSQQSSATAGTRTTSVVCPTRRRGTSTPARRSRSTRSGAPPPRSGRTASHSACVSGPARVGPRHRAEDVLRAGGQGLEHAGTDPVRGRGARCRQRRRQVDVGVTAQGVPGELNERRPPGGELGDAQRGLGIGDSVLVRQHAARSRTA